jgi:tRNA(Ile)-lysidine synthase
MNLLHDVAAALRQATALTKLDIQKERLVVGVSGGADSLALLDALARLLPVDQLVVAHLDHGLRPSSAAEAEAVRGMAVARGLASHIERIDVAGQARAGGLSLEEAGRAARYDFFARVARAEGARVIAVGHHVDDQVETILMHLLRGAGPGGLRGMPVAGPLPGQPGLWLLRPLLAVDRATIEAYGRENDLAPIADASNADTTFTRNRLRHELLPLLEQYNPQVRERLRTMAATLAAEDDLLAGLEDEAWRAIAAGSGSGWVRLRRDAWRAQPLALRRRLLRRAYVAIRPGVKELGFAALEAARRVAEEGTTGARAALPGGIALRVGYGALLVSTGEPPAAYPQLAGTEPISLPTPGAGALANGWRLVATPVTAVDLPAIRAAAGPWTATVALDENAALVVRPRRPGERIRPLGLGGSASLKKVMIDRKIPAAARARWPLVATAEHPVWLVGHVLDERARVGPESRRIIHLECLCEANEPG